MSKHPFVYRKASPSQGAEIERSMGEYAALYDKIETQRPPGRYRSLALTALEESAMWLNKAIAFEEES